LLDGNSIGQDGKKAPKRPFLRFSKKSRGFVPRHRAGASMAVLVAFAGVGHQQHEVMTLIDSGKG